MIKRILILVLFFCISSVFVGCAETLDKRTEMDSLFYKNFKGFSVPEINKIMAEGKNRNYSYATFDDIWDSAIIVLIQEGIVIHSSKDSGIIVTIPTQQYIFKRGIGHIGKRGFGRFFYIGYPPIVTFVERGNAINVHLCLMEDTYRKSGLSKKNLIELTAEQKEGIAKTFFDRLATQAYAGEKWKYLYK